MSALTGWTRTRPRHYRHDSGAKVSPAREGVDGWSAISAVGDQSNGHLSLPAAMRVALGNHPAEAVTPLATTA